MQDNSQIPPITSELIAKCITELKNGKAADMFGITSEHLKHAGPAVVRLIAELIQNIVNDCVLPPCLKTGVITPVFKNKNSPQSPDNYRRITVTSLIGKILEKVLVIPTKKILEARLNKLQRGFCNHSSSINTAFLLSESIAEARDNKEILYTALLDASKAFDVVWHPGMLFSLHQHGITGNLWLLYQDMYSGMTSRVKWDNDLSDQFIEGQGVRQGGIPSTELFKSRGNKLLDNLENSGLGYRIGITSVAAPTCADDVIMISGKSIDLQAMLDIAAHDASCERYQFSSTKTKIMVLNNRRPPKTWDSGDWWRMAGKQIDVSSQEKHLGLMREPIDTASATVAANINKARRCSYSLMGAGMYGMNGNHPEVSISTCGMSMLSHDWRTASKSINSTRLT